MKKNFLFFFCLVFTLQLFSQEKLASDYLSRKGEVYFSFTVNDKSILNTLTNIISLDAVNGNSVTAYANKNEFAEFLKYKIDYNVLPHPGDALLAEMEKGSGNRATWDKYPTIAEYNTMMYDFEKNYPSLCKIYEIGTSVKGNKILFAKISKNLNVRENEPQFMFCSTIHGDEATGYVNTLRLIDHLLSNYGKNSRITNLIDNIEIWINPLENPDGFVAGTRSNANNVDLNRNFKNPSGTPTLQKENKDFQTFLNSKYFVLAGQFHGGIEAFMVPWAYKATPLIPDDNWYVRTGRAWVDTAHIYAPSGYLTDGTNGVARCSELYLANNTFADYVNYYAHGRATFMEISKTKSPAATTLPNFWNYNYRSILNFMETCLYGIRGLVTDSVTGVPIKALVTVVNHDADSSQVYSTPDVGNYHRMIAPGTYTLKFTSSCYTDRVISNINVASYKSTTYQNVKMVCKPTCNCTTGIDNRNDNSSVLVFPNPFNSKTTISYTLSDAGNLNVTMYDMYGRIIEKINDSMLPAGNYEFTWNAEKHSKGIYFCMIRSNKGVVIKKITSK